MSAPITFVPAADVFKGAVFALAGDTGSYFSPLPKHTFANSTLLTPSGFVWWCQLCEVFGSPFKWRSFILGKFGVEGWRGGAWGAWGYGGGASYLFICCFFVVVSKCFSSADLEASPRPYLPLTDEVSAGRQIFPRPSVPRHNPPPKTNENTFHTSAGSCSSLSRPF